MRKLAILLLFGVPLLVPPVWGDDDPEPPGKGKELLGNWVVVKVVGKGPGGPVPNDLMLTFEKDKMVVNVGDRDKLTHKYVIDAKKKPPHIDFTDGNSGKKIEGIYKIDKGELYLCIGEATNRRPANFDGKEEPVIVMKRQQKKK